ncbi:ABC transporter substrate-binding protein [Yinghuangia sp. YIM S10712]|uniref:ABC transporter substrate-binding protein n=1 Tax=Yinghuangia sp. YIM S10712 TaxID=3436930 RepID=UPI003F530716
MRSTRFRRRGRTRAIAAATIVAGLLAAGCGRSGDGGGEAEAGQPASGPPMSADFGDLTQVCRPGTPTGSPAQGVTEDDIQVGVMSDIGFSKNPEFPDAAEVFTSWCNDAGGINGRKLKPVTRDVKMNEVRQRVIDACREDFALVGGGAGYDGLGTKDRLSCLLPDFPGQTTQTENQGSDLQVSVQSVAAGYWPKEGLYNWLLKEANPDSKSAIGIILGDSAPTRVMRDKTIETLRAVGADAPIYIDFYPAAGVSDWTPYAQAVKDKKVKGLIWLGDFRNLAKLEQVMTTMQYKPDWIDTHSNSYSPDFIDVAGRETLAFQNNLSDIGGFHPLEIPGPAVQDLKDLYAKYAPGARITYPALKAFSAWLLFAKSAVACGNDLTRRCVYETAGKETSWTGGGLQAPTDLSQKLPVKCHNVLHATPDGWRAADFRPTDGVYRCDAPATRLTGDYGRPFTLADVGKSMDEFR